MSENPTVVDFVIDYLRANPDFFMRHPDLFLHLRVPGQAPDGSRSPGRMPKRAAEGCAFQPAKSERRSKNFETRS